jgi:hypothetical protein
MGIGGNEGIQAHPKPLGNKEHGIPRLHSVSSLETRRTGCRNSAGGRWGHGTGNAEHIAGEDYCRVGNVGIGGNEGIEADPKPLGNKEHGISRLHCIPALEPRRTGCGNAAWRLGFGNTEDVAGEDDIGIWNLWVGRNQGIQAHPKPLGNEEHGVARLHCIPTLEPRRTGCRNATLRRRLGTGNTEDVAGEDDIGIWNLRVGCNQSIQAHSKPLGNEEHGVARLHCIPTLEPRRTGCRNATLRRRRSTGDAEDITGEDQGGIGNVRIGGNEGIEAYSKPLGNEEHGVPRLHCVATLESRGTRGWDPATRLCCTGDTEDIAGENQGGIGNVGVSCNEGIEAYPKPLGNEEHGVARLHCIPALKTRETGHRHPSSLAGAHFRLIYPLTAIALNLFIHIEDLPSIDSHL